MNEEIINKNSKLLVSKYVEIFENNLENYPMAASMVNKIMQDSLRHNYETIDNYSILKCRYDYCIDCVKKDILNTLSRHNTNMLKIMFFNLAEHIAEVHIYIYTRIYDISGKQYFEFYAPDSLKQGLHYENGSELINKINEQNIGQVSTLMGMDKNFLQYLFILINELENNDTNEELWTYYEFWLIYQKIIGLVGLIEERDFIANNFEQCKPIEINDGIVVLPEHLQRSIIITQNESIREAIITDTSMDERMFRKLQNSFFVEYKFITEDLFILFEKFIEEPEISSNKISIIPKDTLITLIDNYVSKNNGIKILDYLLLKVKDKSDEVKNISSYKSRLLKNPFIEITIEGISCVMVAPFLLYYAYNILKKEIRYGCTSQVNPDILKKMNNKIVLNIENELKKCNLKYMANTYIKRKSENKNYEVDLLFVKNDCLYIAECKDIISKFNYDDTKNDVRRLRKEYIPNLNLKTEVIKENIFDYKEKFDCDIKEVRKLIVFKYYSRAKEALEDVLSYSDISILTEAQLLLLINE